MGPIAVAPLLFNGDTPGDLPFPVTAAASAVEAHRLMSDGTRVLVPIEATARETLALFGHSPAQIEQDIHFGKTGSFS